MGDRISLTLANPFLIGIHSFALLLIGAAIGAHWGHSPGVAMWMIVLAAGLMVAHDMLAYSIFFFVTTAWALRAARKREVAESTKEDVVVKTESFRTSNTGKPAQKQRRH